MKKKATDRVQKHINTRKRELKATFAEMVQMINDYGKIAPLAFIDGNDAAPGVYVFPERNWRSGAFNKFEYWVERWMGALFPNTILNQQKIVDHDFGKDPDAIYMDLVYDAKKFGFVLGYLVGCHAMGADRHAMIAKAEGFMIDDIGHRKWGLEQEREKD
jgi:hypothetical protein